jgi:hypothetical protein
MGKNILSSLNRGHGRREVNDRWMMCIEGIVAINEDPEHQHRIKVVIPAIDENSIYDKWCRQLGCSVLGEGYGSFYVPPVGSEVILFGRLGQKHNLYFLSVYNEDFIVPADFRDSAIVGVRAPADMKHIAEGDYQLRAGRVHIETDASLRIIAGGGVFIGDRRIG